MTQNGFFSDATNWIAGHWDNLRIANFIHLAWILVLAFAFSRLLRALEGRFVARWAAEGRVTSMRRLQVQTLLGFLRSIGTFLIASFAILTALPELGISVAPLTVVAGLGGVALGFGAQNLVRDWINGVLIVLEDQYVVGDTVQIGETTGRVEEVTLRQTVIRDAQGARVYIPNGEIRRVANMSRDFSQIFLDVQVPAGAAGDRALASLDRVAAELRADAAWAPALVDGPRVLGIEALTPAGATVRLQFRTAPQRQYDVARELRRRIAARFAQEGVDFASEQRVVLVNPAGPARTPLTETEKEASAAGSSG
ncbi:MAG TPA: mechanosensitive ion channel family protein [Candidatus Acidoferrales bacterium]|nr:mechanosensitive ion channel family protein [Candidatus Acidoferrales bacterium]